MPAAVTVGRAPPSAARWSADGIDLLCRRLHGILGRGTFIAFAALSLGGCTAQGNNAFSGNAFAGPNPGGGFPCPHNSFADCAER
jgi:hypothetical protein